jgi:hypothetical protein
MGFIRQSVFFGNGSYPAVLTKRLQRRIKRNLLKGLGFGQQVSDRQSGRLAEDRRTDHMKTDCELAQAVRILTFTGKEGGCGDLAARFESRPGQRISCLFLFYSLP